ncbi:LOW QUALITY PROTEIN: hypothetical protein U9M48_043717 [Paspalum notatum var. saurae]|uniref:Reverse transcriptase zinc-binding domain-containing protein n=1 Tax=Paspalum notatum var. saurae TaxID=547442 RepID=A0AAQ3UY17_PASNO
MLSSSIKNFLCTYLSLPLAVLKPSKADFMKVIDKVADKLPGWKAPLLNKAGWLVVVKSVLTAVTIHILITWDLPKWVIKAIDKLRRGFVWLGQKQTNGGNCLISWGRRPLCYGGLGVLDLERFGWSLQLRWLWMLKTDATRSWAGLAIQVSGKAHALFDMAVVNSVGNGTATKFWTDCWLHGKTLSEWAPNLFSLVPKRAVRRRTVSQALIGSWVADIRGAFTVQVLVEYLAIWEMVDGLELRPEGQSNSLLGRGFGRGGHLPIARFSSELPSIIVAGPLIGWQSVGCPTSLAAHFVTKLMNQYNISLCNASWPGRFGFMCSRRLF